MRCKTPEVLVAVAALTISLSTGIGVAGQSTANRSLLALSKRNHTLAIVDPNTLQVETDAGRQIRLFHFGAWTPPSDAPATWQGDSVATWETPRPVGGGGGVGPSQAEQGRGAAPNDKDVAKHGDLKVVTTHIRPGYLRKNGIPYGASAAMTEYWDLNKETNGQPWIVITALVNDPVYLQAEWVTALHFKKEPDGSKWDPSPCSSRW